MRICTLGDLLLDVIVRLAEPLAAGADATATTSVGAGGQAANVAAWAVELGASARFVGKRADDAAGRLAAEELGGRGVEVVGPVAEGANGVVVSLVGADGDRTMASDRGVAPLLRAEELDLNWFRGCDWLHLAGYSLLRRPIDEAGAKAAGAAHALGASISVDLSSWSAIRAFGVERFRERLRALRPDVVFGNEQEWELVDGFPFGPVLRVVKRGPRGFSLVEDGGTPKSFTALTVDVVDTTGAGDALAAGFLVGGPEVALEAAAQCVAQLGAMP